MKAHEIKKKLCDKCEAVRSYGDHIRMKMGQQAQKAQEYTQKILKNSLDTHAEKQKNRMERFRKLHIEKDRVKLKLEDLAKRISNFSLKRSKYGVLVSKNRMLLCRRDKWEQDDRVREMRVVDARIRSLKSRDDVRKSKQTMMIKNCLDKEKMKRITRKLKNINNKEKFDRIVKRLGIIVTEQRDV